MYDTITIIVAVLQSSSSRLVTHSATNLLTYANSIAVRRRAKSLFGENALCE